MLSIAGGWVELPPLLGGQPRFTRFLDGVFAEHGGAGATKHAATGGEAEHAGAAAHDQGDEILTMAIAIAASLGRHRHRVDAVRTRLVRRFRGPRRARTDACPPRLAGFWLRGWDFDRLYDALLVRPFVAHRAPQSRRRRRSPPARDRRRGARRQRASCVAAQTGRLRWYAAAIAAGAILALALVFYA